MAYQTFTHQIWWVMVCYDLAHQIRCAKHTFSGRCDITPMVCCSFGGHSTPQFLQCASHWTNFGFTPGVNNICKFSSNIYSTLVTSLFTLGLYIKCIYYHIYWHSKLKKYHVYIPIYFIYITKYSVVLLHHIYPIVDGQCTLALRQPGEIWHSLW